MKKILSWLKRYWHIPLVAVALLVGAVGSLLIQRRLDPVAGLKKELKAIDAGAKAAELAAEKGHELAIAKLEMEHSEKLDELDEKQKVKAEKMKKNPEALAKWLVKLGG